LHSCYRCIFNGDVSTVEVTNLYTVMNCEYLKIWKVEVVSCFEVTISTVEEEEEKKKKKIKKKKIH
jgi:hypothetical protein